MPLKYIDKFVNNSNRLNFNNSLAAVINAVRQFDWFMAAGIGLLVAFGLLALYSLDQGVVGIGSKIFRQAGWALISIFAFLGFSMIDYNQLRKSAWLLFGLSFSLLAAVLFLGQTIHGTTGWLKIGLMNFQPVELVKIALIIILARVLSRADFSTFKSIVVSLGFTFILFGLVMLQPDFGSGVLFLVIWFGLVFFRGISWHAIAAIILIAAIGGVLAWSSIDAYQKDRIFTFLDPFKDSARSTSSYQAVQSIVAVGSGKIFGRGLGSGSQSQLHFLPEASTDFVFAAIAEEFGFLGIMLFFAAIFMILYRMYAAAKSSRDDFGYLVISGFFTLIACETIINSAMNVGLFPIMGIPLPLVSYGGSSLLSTFIGLGIVQSIYRQKKALKLA